MTYPYGYAPLRGRRPSSVARRADRRSSDVHHPLARSVPRVQSVPRRLADPRLHKRPFFTVSRGASRCGCVSSSPVELWKGRTHLTSQIKHSDFSVLLLRIAAPLKSQSLHVSKKSGEIARPSTKIKVVQRHIRIVIFSTAKVRFLAFEA